MYGYVVAGDETIERVAEINKWRHVRHFKRTPSIDDIRLSKLALAEGISTGSDSKVYT
jgi:hypothetical protein